MKLSEYHFHLACVRKDHIHKATRTIVDLLPKKIVLEDLNVSGMIKNRHLSKAIQNSCLSEISRQIEYKAKNEGIEVEFADRFYPSSKTCSNCGSCKKDLKLSDRIYKCSCGFSLDRDMNAARNLRQYKGKS